MTERTLGVSPPPFDPAREPTRGLVPLPDGRSIAYAEAGSGPTVVLIHGTLTLLQDMWLGLASSFLPNHRVIALDRPGHGSSERLRLFDASPWRQAEIIREALHAIGGVDPIIVGHSYGGTVALCYGLAYPIETVGVVALAPLCFPEIRLEHLLFGARSIPVLGEAIAQVLAADVDPALLTLLWHAIFLPQAMPAGFAAGFPFAHAMGPEHMSVEGEDAMAATAALVRAALAYGACPVPVRILGGTADLVINNALHGFLAAQMMPDAHFTWLPGAGHMLHHFAQEKVVEAVHSLRQFGGQR